MHYRLTARVDSVWASLFIYKLGTLQIRNDLLVVSLLFIHPNALAYESGSSIL